MTSVWSSEPEKKKRNVASGYTIFANRQTSLVPESQICQRCGGTSCRFPVALVSRRSYFQSTQTHHSRHPLHSPGSAGFQLERENRLGKGPYHLFTAETAADCYRRVANEDHTAWRHNSTLALIAARITKLMWRITISTDTGGRLCACGLRVCFGYPLPEREKGCRGGVKSNFPSWGVPAEQHLVTEISLCHSAPQSICTA